MREVQKNRSKAGDDDWTETDVAAATTMIGDLETVPQRGANLEALGQGDKP